jgi:hypothetical protein
MAEIALTGKVVGRLGHGPGIEKAEDQGDEEDEEGAAPDRIHRRLSLLGIRFEEI